MAEVGFDAVFGPVPAGKPFVKEFPNECPENSVKPTNGPVRFLRIGPLRPRRVFHVGLVQHGVFCKQPNVSNEMLFVFQTFRSVDCLD